METYMGHTKPHRGFDLFGISRASQDILATCPCFKGLTPIC